MSTTARLRKWGLVALLALSLIACIKQEPPKLVQAADTIGDILELINLSRSMFAVAFPGGSPSQYVSYLFSDMGAAEWPSLTREWKLPMVEPAPGIEFIYESNLELGMSAQSFPAP